MSKTKLNYSAFKKKIDEDINWLLTHTEDCLERNHIISVLTYSKFFHTKDNNEHQRFK